MIEVKRQSIIKVINIFILIWPGLNKNNAPNEQLSIQKKLMSARTRLNVTTCLYLMPIFRARSLSTLIAVDVNIDTADKTRVEMAKIISMISLWFKFVIRGSFVIA